MSTSVGPIASTPGLPGGNRAAIDVTTATVIKSGQGICVSVSVTVPGTAAGAVYDNSATTGNSAANQFGTIPDAVGTYDFDWPCGTGIVVAPGSGQTLAVSFT
jgi:hypothetical protein